MSFLEWIGLITVLTISFFAFVFGLSYLIVNWRYIVYKISNPEHVLFKEDVENYDWVDKKKVRNGNKH